MTTETPDTAPKPTKKRKYTGKWAAELAGLKGKARKDKLRELQKAQAAHARKARDEKRAAEPDNKTPEQIRKAAQNKRYRERKKQGLSEHPKRVYERGRRALEAKRAGKPAGRRHGESQAAAEARRDKVIAEHKEHLYAATEARREAAIAEHLEHHPGKTRETPGQQRAAKPKHMGGAKPGETPEAAEIRRAANREYIRDLARRKKASNWKPRKKREDAAPTPPEGMEATTTTALIAAIGALPKPARRYNGGAAPVAEALPDERMGRLHLAAGVVSLLTMILRGA